MVYSSYETSFMDYSLKFIRRVYLYMASIRDVAKEAGVAICTVSRLINGTANVEPETQKKIEDAMKKLDYVPNELARGMFKGRSNSIAMLVPNIQHPWFSSLASEIEKILYEKKYKFMLFSTSDDKQREKECFKLLKSNIVDGIICGTFGCNKKRLNTDNFADIEARLDGVVIENKDFEDLIKVYDREKALFYCDPPYHKTERHYTVKFTEDDHERLCRVLHQIKGRFVLSYNDDKYVRDLYKDYNIQAVTRNNSLSSGDFKEVIITNF